MTNGSTSDTYYYDFYTYWFEIFEWLKDEHCVDFEEWFKDNATRYYELFGENGTFFEEYGELFDQDYNSGNVNYPA